MTTDDLQAFAAALVAALSEAVLLCAPSGRVLARNAEAVRLLAEAGAAEEDVAASARAAGLRTRAEHPTPVESTGEHPTPATFSVEKAGGTPLLASVRPLHGRDEVLVVLRRPSADAPDGAPDRLLRELTEAMREPLGSVRAAIETMMAYPAMDEAVAAQFKEIILEQSQALSAHLERTLSAYSRQAKTDRPLQSVSGEALLRVLRRALSPAAGVPVEADAPLEPVGVRVDRASLVPALCFLAERVENAVRCPALVCRLRARRQVAVLELAWRGRPVSAQRLARWAAHPLPLGGDALARTTLREVAERHGGAAWTHTGQDEAAIRLLLPTA